MNKNSYSNSYKDAGVDVTAGYKAVELMKQYVGRTVTKGVIDGIGGFGGLFELDITGIKKPVLVSGTDGVGTISSAAVQSPSSSWIILPAEEISPRRSQA